MEKVIFIIIIGFFFIFIVDIKRLKKQFFDGTITDYARKVMHFLKDYLLIYHNFHLILVFGHESTTYLFIEMMYQNLNF
jgi:hypothetical protein